MGWGALSGGHWAPSRHHRGDRVAARSSPIPCVRRKARPVTSERQGKGALGIGDPVSSCPGGGPFAPSRPGLASAETVRSRRLAAGCDVPAGPKQHARNTDGAGRGAHDLAGNSVPKTSRGSGSCPAPFPNPLRVGLGTGGGCGCSGVLARSAGAQEGGPTRQQVPGAVWLQRGAKGSAMLRPGRRGRCGCGLGAWCGV